MECISSIPSEPPRELRELSAVAPISPEHHRPAVLACVCVVSMRLASPRRISHTQVAAGDSRAMRLCVRRLWRKLQAARWTRSCLHRSAPQHKPRGSPCMLASKRSPHGRTTPGTAAADWHSSCRFFRPCILENIIHTPALLAGESGRSAHFRTIPECITHLLRMRYTQRNFGGMSCVFWRTKITNQLHSEVIRTGL